MFVINTKKTKTVVNGLLRIYQKRLLKWVLTSPRETTQASDTSSLLTYLALCEKLVTKFFCFAFNICLWSKLILLHPSLITGSLNHGINWCTLILIIQALMKYAMCNLLQTNLISPCIKQQQKKTPCDAISILTPCFSISLVSNF